MNRPTKNPHLVASDRLIACQFYDQTEARPMSHKPARFVVPAKSETPPLSAEQMKRIAYNAAHA